MHLFTVKFCRFSESSSISAASGSQDLSRLPILHKLDTVNEALAVLGVDKISKKSVNNKKVVEKKIVEVGEMIRNKLRVSQPSSVGAEVIDQLQAEFDNMSKNDQYRVLTVMPRESPREFLQKTFGVSEHMARIAKVIQTEKGLLATPNPKPGKRLPEETIEKVKEFYESDKVSRQMPGKKDCVSMLVNGIKQKVQKRMILCTEYEAFLLFKEEYKDVKIGHAKFAEARPKNVVLPGSAGTHVVCVCTYHQNPKLMIANSGISSKKEFKKIVGGDAYDGEIKYRHLLAQILCNPPRVECWLKTCSECEDTSKLENKITTIFSDLDIDEITYKQWESTDRTELLTVTESSQDFVSSLLSKLQILKTHQFINDMQTKFYYGIKETLPAGKVLAVGDFSENYSFVIQDAAQGVHWSNTSCTLHPWMCYYKEGNIAKTFTVLFISDCLTHNTVAVYAFQKILIALLKERVDLKAVQYFSDGCSKQYKNKKNFLNITYHKQDFGVPAEWGFSATSHGKGPWDGLAGSVKREAALESLRRPVDNQILTPQEFYKFAKEKFKKVRVEFVSQEFIEDLESEVLVERFKKAKTIPGTLGFHSFSPIPGVFDKKSRRNIVV